MGKSVKIYADYKIDKKDIEIIKMLEEDGRIPILQLAKKVKLSHETVRYRINKLRKTGVIEKFIVRIKKKKLGYHIYAVIMIGLGITPKKNGTILSPILWNAHTLSQ